MARTIAEIKRTMTDAFMANATLREIYGLAEGDGLRGQFLGGEPGEHPFLHRGGMLQ